MALLLAPAYYHLRARLKQLEADSVFSAQERELVKRMGTLLMRAFSGELHHPHGHEHADKLLEKLDGGPLTDRDRSDFDRTMAKRVTDPSVTDRERNIASRMPVMLDLLDEWSEVSEAWKKVRHPGGKT